MVGLVPYSQLKEEAALIAAAITAASQMAAQDSFVGYLLRSFSIIIKVGAVLGLKFDDGRADNGPTGSIYAMAKDVFASLGG